MVHRAIEPRREARIGAWTNCGKISSPLVGALKRKRCAALMGEARKLLGEGSLDPAQNLLREVLQLDPDSRKAQRLRTELRAAQAARAAERKRRFDSQLHDAEAMVASRALQSRDRAAVRFEPRVSRRS